jgi:3-hydroxybutyryl-CoA dehydrogenase
MRVKKVGICGAGTMGSGIAQVFAQYGFETILFDISADQLQKAEISIKESWKKAVEKGKLSAEQFVNAERILHFTTVIENVQADLIIEAIVEKLEPKQELFATLCRHNSPHTIFATNTSSISITKIASSVIEPERCAGMHFFNPAPVMKLVEIIRGSQTNTSVIDTLIHLTQQIEKTAVVCKDAPGFIVNRVARHYYVESLKLLEEQISHIENIDSFMESAGFKMGPFKLMDVIGNDINFAVTSSLFSAFHGEPRFRPSRIQEQKVHARHLGKKTGKGFYDYS